MSLIHAPAGAINCRQRPNRIRCGAPRRGYSYIHPGLNCACDRASVPLACPHEIAEAPRRMPGIPQDKLEKMIGRWSAIQAELNAGVGQATYAKLTKEFAQL